MKRLLLALVLCASAASHAAETPVSAKADAAAGAAKAAVCGACHGPTGNSANPEWPSLAGQGAAYLYAQMKAYKDGKRKNVLMQAQMAALSDQDMRDLAAHYAALEARPGVTSKDAVAVAEAIYRAGVADRKIPACAACHGPQGRGNAAAAYPRLSGQQSVYTAAQLRAYRAGERSVGASGQMMAEVAAQLSDAEIEALASYLQGLQ